MVRARTPVLAAAVLAASIAATAGAQSRLLEDIDPYPYSVGSKPFGLATIANTTFFWATTEELGTELWKTDGTDRGTQPVRDIRPGPASSPDKGYSIYPTRVVGSRLLFPASDGEHGVELWASDGTRDGTRMLADINHAPSSTVFTFGPVIGSVLYFRAETPEAGYELWRTDGTAAGTRMVVDLNPGPDHSVFFRSLMSEFGPLLLFYAWDGTRSGLFATDGTAEGTRFVVPSDSYFGGRLGDRFLFASKTEQSGPWTLLALDQAGNAQTLRAGLSERPTLFTVVGGIAYFVANDGTSGYEVWRSDGTPAGTSMLADLTPGPDGSQVLEITALGQRILIDTPQKLWGSDGTAAGTRPLLTSHRGWTGCVAKGEFYFLSLRDSALDLMKTDGTPEGTILVAGSSSGVNITGIDVLVPRPDGVFFTARDPHTNQGLEPWISDGTSAGTRLLTMIAPPVTLSSSPHSLANIGGRLFFRASRSVLQGVRSHATWISDGTSTGTSPAPDSSSEYSYYYDDRAVASGGLYYFVKRTAAGRKLYRTDGTVVGTVALADLGDYAKPVPFRNGILWADVNCCYAVELWFTDGTAGGTTMLARVTPKQRSGGIVAQPITVAGDHAFFGLDEYTVGIPEPVLLESQVWRTDGTVAGTHLFNDDDTGPFRYPRAFTRVGRWIYFVVFRQGLELWRMDVGSGESFPFRNLSGVDSIDLARLGNTLLLVMDGQLWRSDGTAEGTTLLREGVPRTFRGATVGNGLFFWFGTVGTRSQIWRSDGTAAGTFVLHEVPHTWAIAQEPRFHFSEGALFFPGNDPIHGIEPWASDGTLEGTRMLADVNPGARSSLPSEFLRIGNVLYVSAEERSVGREPWAITIHCTGKCPPRRQSVRR